MVDRASSLTRWRWTATRRRGDAEVVAWAYLVGGDGDGQFFEHDDQALTVHPGCGAMLTGPGLWTYQASGRQVSGAHGRCEVYQAYGRWVPYEEQGPEEGTAE